MRTSALRFPSPAPTAAADPGFKAFVASEQSHRSHNPWPQLADPTALRYAWTQPLLRLTYLPISVDQMIFLDNEFSAEPAWLEGKVFDYHELLHTVLDFTPAKAALRLYLSDAYGCLLKLLGAPGDAWTRETEVAWRELQRINALLREMTEHMVLVEELLATAFGFDTLAFSLRHRWHLGATDEVFTLLGTYETAWVKSQGKRFTSLYFGHGGSDGFKRLVSAVRRDNTLPHGIDIARLSIFLQPIQQTSDSFVVQDQSERCLELIDVASTAGRSADLWNWLDRRLQEDSSGHSAWRNVLRQASARHDTNAASQLLWKLSRGSGSRRGYLRSLKLLTATEPRYLPWQLNKPKWYAAGHLYPQCRAGKWYIVPYLQGPKSDHYVLLALEALRQQLDTRIGFACPGLTLVASDERSCYCRPNFHLGIHRLSRWALEGRFGTWTYIPALCAPS